MPPNGYYDDRGSVVRPVRRRLRTTTKLCLTPCKLPVNSAIVAGNNAVKPRGPAQYYRQPKSHDFLYCCSVVSLFPYCLAPILYSVHPPIPAATSVSGVTDGRPTLPAAAKHHLHTLTGHWIDVCADYTGFWQSPSHLLQAIITEMVGFSSISGVTAGYGKKRLILWDLAGGNRIEALVAIQGHEHRQHYKRTHGEFCG